MADIASVAARQSAQEERKIEGLTMLVFSDDLDKALTAFIIANGAAAMDIPVTIFFTFWGVNIMRLEGPVKTLEKKSFMENMFGWMMPKGTSKLALSKMNMGGIGTALMKKEMSKKNIANLPKLMQEARDQGVRLLICTMTMDMMGIKKDELLPGVEFGSVVTFIDSASNSHTTMFI
jgi:peroxiredoxin family protein